MKLNQRMSGLEASGWLACAASTALAAFVLFLSKVGVDLPSLLIALLPLSFLIGANVVYRRWRPEPVISEISGALAIIIWSGAAAGIISLAGLRIGAPLIDAKLAAFDKAWLFETSSTVFATAGSPAIATLLGIAYTSSFPVLFALVVFLGFTKRTNALWQLAFSFAFTAVGCSIISVIFPAAGAFAHFGYPTEVQDGLPPGAGTYHLPKFEYYRTALAPVISFASLQGVVTFPSFHCCLALMTIAA